VLELYIVDKIKKGVFIFLRLFIDDSAVSLTKLNIEVSNEFIHRLLCTGDVHGSLFVFVMKDVECISRWGVVGVDVSDMFYILNVDQFDLYRRSGR
jgi:hypothetical protein